MTLPCAGAPTAVRLRPAFSKLSAPLTSFSPVIGLKLMTASSLVVTLSATMSATALTLSATEELVVKAPSDVDTLIESLPL